MDASNAADRRRQVAPHGSSIDIEAIRYEADPDGTPESHFYWVEWCLRFPTAWVEAPASTDLLSRLAATSHLLSEGVSIGDLRRMSAGSSMPVEWGYGPTVATLVHVLTYHDEPGVYPLAGPPPSFAELPSWAERTIREAVRSHIAERAEVAS